MAVGSLCHCLHRPPSRHHCRLLSAWQGTFKTNKQTKHLERGRHFLLRNIEQRHIPLIYLLVDFSLPWTLLSLLVKEGMFKLSLLGVQFATLLE